MPETMSPREKVELKPCPFCGGKPSVSTYETESLWSHDQVTYTRVSCGECEIEFATEPGYELEAPEAWNRRAALASSGDHAELARLAEAATPGEWELDGHQCLSAPDGTIVVDYSCCCRGEWEANAAYLHAVQPSRVIALIAEVAALRGERDRLAKELHDEVCYAAEQSVNATEAERKLAEAVGLLKPFSEAAECLEDHARDTDHIWEQPAAMCISAGQLRAISTFLSKEAERG